MIKEAQAYNVVKIASSINGVGRAGQVYAKNETQSPTYTIHKNKLKWIKDLNVSHDTIKVLKENVGREISGNPCSNIFVNISLKAREIKEKINKWDYIKFKRFCTAKETIIKMKRKPTVSENVFANNTLDKGLISKRYKELI